jgi:hypothetical protein
MILPLGEAFQKLVILRKKGGTTQMENDLAVRFVPMVRGGRQDKADELGSSASGRR